MKMRNKQGNLEFLLQNVLGGINIGLEVSHALNVRACFDSHLGPYCAWARERAVRRLPPGSAEAWLSLSLPEEKRGSQFLYV